MEGTRQKRHFNTFPDKQYLLGRGVRELPDQALVTSVATTVWVWILLFKIHPFAGLTSLTGVPG